MSDETKKPELTHDREAYGCTIKYSFHGERAVLTDPDGVEHEFTENLGMVAQGAPNALLLALHAAKKDESARIEAKRAARKAAQGEPVGIDDDGSFKPIDELKYRPGADAALDESEGN